MSTTPELSDIESSVLQTVHAEGSVDIYAIARTVGCGPRSVQDAVKGLSRKDLVIVSRRGMEVHCTPKGQEVGRAQQA